jgi:hypothetical protein
MPNRRASASQLRYASFVTDVSDRFEQVTDQFLDEFNEHIAYAYLIADVFETTESSQFRYTDGANDGGIDFYVHTDGSYAIYQCKCPDIATLVESGDVPATFDAACVREIVTAARFVLSEGGSYSYKADVMRLRTDFHRDRRTDPEIATLTAVLAIAGDLTDAAKRLFEAEREALAEDDVELRLITWRTTASELMQMGEPENVSITLELSVDDPHKEVLSHHDYWYVLAHGSDLYAAWRQHGWSLFEWNVRWQLHRSPINKRIVSSLEHAKTRRIFHHLNNGILVTCNQVSGVRRNKLQLHGAQIVNGCQTVCAIRDAYESLGPAEQASFDQDVRIQVKVIKTTDLGLIDQIVITTNDQNPMNDRNLKSNTSEQKSLQKHFQQLGTSWFYERKDGELDSLRLNAGHFQGFRLADYQVPGSGRRALRRLSSEVAAKNWYAWIGYSDLVSLGGLKFFSDDKLYARVFRNTPTDDYWQHFADDPLFVPDEDGFASETPSVHQYLLAAAAAAHAKQSRVSWKQLKEEAVERGIRSRDLVADSRGVVNDTKVSEFLAKDVDYKIGRIRNNLADAMVELYSFVLARRYGPLTAACCRKILAADDVARFCTSGFKVNSDSPTNGVLTPIAGFLEYCVKQYYYSFEGEIEAAPRLRTYLGMRKTVERLREKIAAYDSSHADMDQSWKQQGKTFSESLPDLQ